MSISNRCSSDMFPDTLTKVPVFPSMTNGDASRDTNAVSVVKRFMYCALTLARLLMSVMISYETFSSKFPVGMSINT